MERCGAAIQDENAASIMMRTRAFLAAIEAAGGGDAGMVCRRHCQVWEIALAESFTVYRNNTECIFPWHLKK